MHRALRKGFVNLLKERLDVLLVQKGYFESRERAKSAIMAGVVYINNQISDKAGTGIDVDAEIFVKENLCPYVSRGGLKLEKAINTFGIQLDNVTAMDIGASTGGFTDCMLKNGAKKVYCVDVGYGQLDYKLRIDPRVVNMEKVNIRYIELDTIPDKIDFISIDVSFISLKMVLPMATQLLSEKGQIVCLVKPQFEAGREQVGKKGIVREKSTHIQVVAKIISYCLQENYYVNGLTFSPMTGAKGNIEYLLYISKGNELPDQGLWNTHDSDLSEQAFTMIEKVVEESHLTLK